jgi:drug/metabolite transporter (DMT)-like permease
MLYGAAACLAIGLLRGHSLALPTTPAWWLSFLYLVLAGSVLTFACFLTLQDRIGPGPTGSIGVMTPLFALMVSVGLEGYRPDAYTAIGAALAVAGNALMLRRGGIARPAAPVPIAAVD